MFFIVSVLVLYVIVSQYLQVEAFSNVTGNIEYVSLNYMKRVVDNSPFFKRMNANDLMVRKAKTATDYAPSYLSGLQPFSSNEQAQLQGLVKTCNARLLQTMFLRAIPWKFAKLDAMYENGWPHTLEDVIILPSNFLAKNTPSNRLVETLIHEKIHVYQRLHKSRSLRLIESWGFKEARIPDYLRPFTRNNPDLSGFFHFNYLAPVQVYDKLNPTSLADSQVIVIDIRAHEMKHVTNGMEMLPFPTGIIHQTEHPYEVMASLIPKIYLDPFGLPHNNPLVQKTLLWCAQFL